MFYQLSRLVLVILSLCSTVAYAAGWVETKASAAVGNRGINAVAVDGYGNVYAQVSAAALWQYTPDSGTWQQVKPPANLGFTLVTSNSCGGISVLDYYNNGQLWQYTTATNTWQQAAANPARAMRPLWMSTATDGNGNFYEYGSPVKSGGLNIWQYNCNANVWQNTAMPPAVASKMQVNALQADDFGHLFVMSANSIYEYDSLFFDKTSGKLGKWLDTNINSQGIETIATDALGNLFAATVVNGTYNLWMYPAQTKQWREIKNNIIVGVPQSGLTNIPAVISDHKGNTYFAASGGSPYQVAIGKYDVNTNTWSSISNNFASSPLTIANIFVDRQDNLYVKLQDAQTKQYSLWKYNTTTSTWTNTNSELNGAAFTPANFTQDKKGNLYAIAMKNGITDVWQYRVDL